MIRVEGTDGRMDGWSDGRMVGWTDGRTCPVTVSLTMHCYKVDTLVYDDRRVINGQLLVPQVSATLLQQFHNHWRTNIYHVCVVSMNIQRFL